MLYFGTNYSADFKLSKIHIKPFSGNYEDWAEFKDLFESCIAKNPKIPKIQKLHHLKTVLSNEPATLIKNLKLRENNFVVAWETLTAHYENKRKVITGYLNRFLDIIPISTSASQSPLDIRNMITTTTDMLTSLPDYDIDTSSWDVLVVHILVQKLDTYNMNRWHEELKASKEMPTFEKFREFLETRKEIIETYDHRRRSTTNTNHPTIAKPKIVKTMVTQKSSQPSMICVFCENNHRNYQCPEFAQANLSKRFQMVRENQLCLINYAVASFLFVDCGSKLRLTVVPAL